MLTRVGYTVVNVCNNNNNLTKTTADTKTATPFFKPNPTSKYRFIKPDKTKKFNYMPILRLKLSRVDTMQFSHNNGFLKCIIAIFILTCFTVASRVASHTATCEGVDAICTRTAMLTRVGTTFVV
jgi:hypothetical protein